MVFALARGAVDALIRVDVELLVGRFVVPVRRMDAVHGAHLDAGGVAGTDARLSDDVGHECPKATDQRPFVKRYSRRPVCGQPRPAGAAGARDLVAAGAGGALSRR